MKLIFALAIYVGSASLWSQAAVDPTLDNMVAAAIAVYAVMAMLNDRIAISALEDSSKALSSCRKQLEEQNRLLALTREAIDSNSVEPLKEYWRARNHSG